MKSAPIDVTNGYEPFPIGKIHNPFTGKLTGRFNPRQKVVVQYPTRLNAMAIDPSRIVGSFHGVFAPGEVVFKMGRMCTVELEVCAELETVEYDVSRDEQLVRHAVSLMTAIIPKMPPFKVKLRHPKLPKHSGFGTSSQTIAATAHAINELMGHAVNAQDLAKYVAQNHGEVIAGNTADIKPVQCIGGSALAGVISGHVLVLAGETKCIASGSASTSFSMVIGSLPPYTSAIEDLMSREIAVFDRFKHTGEKYGKEIAYRMLHEAIPAILNDDLVPLGKLIFDYRFNMGSIENCSFTHPSLLKVSSEIRHLYDPFITPVLSLSSVGPSFFAITLAPRELAARFEAAGLHVSIEELYGGQYLIEME